MAPWLVHLLGILWERLSDDGMVVLLLVVLSARPLEPLLELSLVQLLAQTIVVVTLAYW